MTQFLNLSDLSAHPWQAKSSKITILFNVVSELYAQKELYSCEQINLKMSKGLYVIHV